MDESTQKLVEYISMLTRLLKEIKLGSIKEEDVYYDYLDFLWNRVPSKQKRLLED